MSFDKRKAMKKIVEDLKDAKIIEPTHSYWAAPSILVKKKDGSYRPVLHYRGLNKQIEKTSWPLSRINDVIDSLDGNCYFFNIDLTSGYFQMAHSMKSHRTLHSNGTLQMEETTHGFGVRARNFSKFNGIDHVGTLLRKGFSIPG